MIYVIDDDNSVSHFVEAVLHEQDYQVEKFSSGEEFLARVNGENFGCVIADQFLPGIHGTDIQNELRRRGSHFSFIMISGAADVPTTLLTMKQGAITILQKPFTVDQLSLAVEEGIAETHHQQAKHAQISDIVRRLTLLSDGETKVMKCLVKGMSHKAISAALDIGMRSVDRRKKDLLQKMQVETIEELISILAKTSLEDDLDGE